MAEHHSGPVEVGASMDYAEHDKTYSGFIFAAKYGALSTNDFVTQAYTEVFGVTPSAGAAANLQGQVAYFTSLYTGAGIAAAQAALLAKGATVGQILGYAITDPTFTAIGSLDDKVKAVLTAAAKGDASVYNKALPNTPNSGAAGVTVQLTAGEVLYFEDGDTRPVRERRGA